MAEAGYIEVYNQLMGDLNAKKELQRRLRQGGQEAPALQQQLEAIDARLPGGLTALFVMGASLHGVEEWADMPQDASEAGRITALSAADKTQVVRALHGLVQQEFKRRVIASEARKCSSFGARYTWRTHAKLALPPGACVLLGSTAVQQLFPTRLAAVVAAACVVLLLVIWLVMSMADDAERAAALTAQRRKEVEQSLQESVDAALQLEEQLQSLGLLRFAARVADIQGSLVAAYVQAQLELIGAQ